MTIKNKDYCQPVDTNYPVLKADCYKRGEEYYAVEPKWDRKEYTEPKEWDGYSEFKIDNFFYNPKYYKELEVTEDGEPVGYVRNGTIIELEVTKDWLDDFAGVVVTIYAIFVSILTIYILMPYKRFSYYELSTKF